MLAKGRSVGKQIYIYILDEISRRDLQARQYLEVSRRGRASAVFLCRTKGVIGVGEMRR